MGVSVSRNRLSTINFVVINPAGPVHTIFTATETSTNGLNSTLQFSITVDPVVGIGLAR